MSYSQLVLEPVFNKTAFSTRFCLNPILPLRISSKSTACLNPQLVYLKISSLHTLFSQGLPLSSVTPTYCFILSQFFMNKIVRSWREGFRVFFLYFFFFFFREGEVRERKRDLGLQQPSWIPAINFCNIQSILQIYAPETHF